MALAIPDTVDWFGFITSRGTTNISIGDGQDVCPFRKEGSVSDSFYVLLDVKNSKVLKSNNSTPHSHYFFIVDFKSWSAFRFLSEKRSNCKLLL